MRSTIEHRPVTAVAWVLLAALLVLFVLPFLLVGGALWWYLRPGRLLKQVGRENAIRRRDAVGPGLLVAAVLAAALLFGTVPAEDTLASTVFWLSAVALALGGMGAVRALSRFGEYRALSGRLDAAGTVESGPAVFSGTARVHEERNRGPLSDEPALCYAVTAVDLLGARDAGFPRIRHHEQSGHPFALEDDTGTVVVEPTDASVQFWEPNRQLVPETTAQPGDDGQRAAIDDICGEAGLNPDSALTYRERRLVPGTDVTVLGTARRAPTDRYARVGDGTQRLVVFFGDAETVRDALGDRLRHGTALAALGVGGAVGMLLSAGVL